MAYPTKIQQVGMEAFNHLDEIKVHNDHRSMAQTYYSRYQLQSNQTYVYSPRERVIDSFEAAQKYKGTMICEHHARKPQSFVYPPREPIVDSFQAAHKYNGVMISENQAKKTAMMTTRKVNNYRNYWSFV